MPKSVTIKNLDGFLLAVIFPIIIVDVVNGLMLKSTFLESVSISQAYKFLLLLLISFRILITSPNKFVILLGLFFVMTIGSFCFNFFYEGKPLYYIQDLIKTSKVISLPLFMFFFLSVFNYKKELEKYFWDFMKFSFGVIFVNLFLGLFGLGYSQYKGTEKNIGHIGFFYSGNELSALMIIVFMSLGYYYWHKKDNIQKYLLFAFVCLVLALLKSTKTTILGVIVVFSVIPFLSYKFYLNKKFVKIFSISFILIPFLFGFVYLGIKSSSLIDRLVFYWYRLDLMTFVFSTRNIYAKDNLKVFDSYGFWGQIFGRGETYIRNKTGRLSEIDFVDILTLYGYLGLFLYIAFLINVFSLIRRKSKNNIKDNLPKFGAFFLIFITILANTAGHIYVSGLVPFYLAITLSFIIRFETEDII